MTPTLLTDKSRLQEVYDLRVTAWEDSENSAYINKYFFPNGWKDRFDDEALHWIIENNTSIVASARIAFVSSIEEFEEDLTAFDLYSSFPIAFFSRLVVHPNFRGFDLTKILDKERIDFLKKSTIQKTIAFADDKRIPQLLTLGFKTVGIVSHLYGNNPKVDYSKALIFSKHE
jgi:predicted GNAT family N-acyltransferase